MSSVGKTVYKVSDVHKLPFGKITEQSTLIGSMGPRQISVRVQIMIQNLDTFAATL